MVYGIPRQAVRALGTDTQIHPRHQPASLLGAGPTLARRNLEYIFSGSWAKTLTFNNSSVYAEPKIRPRHRAQTYTSRDFCQGCISPICFCARGLSLFGYNPDTPQLLSNLVVKGKRIANSGTFTITADS